MRILPHETPASSLFEQYRESRQRMSLADNETRLFTDKYAMNGMLRNYFGSISWQFDLNQLDVE